MICWKDALVLFVANDFQESRAVAFVLAAFNHVFVFFCIYVAEVDDRATGERSKASGLSWIENKAEAYASE